MGVYRWICTDCGRELSAREAEYLCPACEAPAARCAEEPLRGVLRAVYEPPACFPRAGATAGGADGAAGDPGAGPVEGRAPWRDQRRYLDLLPLERPDWLPPPAIGPTPLVAPAFLRRELGLPRLYIKDETVLPTGSLKDRASSLVVAKARERQRKTVVTASTGNAATALAGMCAAAGLDCVILVPAAAPRAKLAQMLVYGARVLRLAANYEQAFALSIVASREFGWYNRSTAYNPYTIEGKKTAAFEIWEQLDREAPDVVVVPTGDGAILAAMEKGFSDLRAAGLCARVPRLVAVQEAGCAPLVSAWERRRTGADSASASWRGFRSREDPAGGLATIADSIRVAVPANGRWALRALEATAGLAVRVTESEILAAISQLGRCAGVFAEPAGAAALAGISGAARAGAVDPGASIVVLVTGSGLKDIDAALAAVRVPDPVAPTIEGLRQGLALKG